VCYYQRHQLVQPNHGTKPHSVPCSPRLQARLAATQPWRPWSPPTSAGVLPRPFQTVDSGSGHSDSRASVDVPRLASSLLLAKIIRDRQEEERSNDRKLRGNYTRSIDVLRFDLSHVCHVFYRAMHYSAKRGLAIACRLSVCPCV